MEWESKGEDKPDSAGPIINTKNSAHEEVAPPTLKMRDDGNETSSVPAVSLGEHQPPCLEDAAVSDTGRKVKTPGKPRKPRAPKASTPGIQCFECHKACQRLLSYYINHKLF